MTRPVIRFRIDFGPADALGPGKIALLEQIHRSGSISQAARELGMSYRRAWLLLEALNAAFCDPVTTSVTGGIGGGGVTLTPLGHDIIRTYRAFEADVQERAARQFIPLARLIRESPSRPKSASKTRMNAR